MEAFIDSNLISTLGQKSLFGIMWFFFVNGGWFFVTIGLVRLWWVMRLYKLEGEYLKKIEYVMLAIDIPRNSEQTPKAMEQVMATLTGPHQEITKKDKYLKGEAQLPFSLEIVSIDGYVQFLIRSPKIHRALTESAIYAHYPDAEITEVDDYTTDIPSFYPNSRYNAWGSELKLAKNQAYPIRTYSFFEDRLSQEFKDPLAGLIETMSHIQKNEQVWFQIIIVPTENEKWVRSAIKEAFKVAGKKTDEASDRSWYDSLFSLLFKLPDWFSWFGTGGAEENKKNDKIDFRVLNLTPGQRAQVEAIELKASKLGFVCKSRLIYISPHAQFEHRRVVSAVFGAIKQFGDLTSNSLKPNKRTKTSATWFFTERRKNARRTRVVKNYKARSWFRGSQWYILNVEELATLYHFPALTVKNPQLKRTEVKKADSPAQLPTYIEELEQNSQRELREQLVGLELDNDYYEQRYAKRKMLQQKQHKPIPTVQAMQRQSQPLRVAGTETSEGIPDNLPFVP